MTESPPSDGTPACVWVDRDHGMEDSEPSRPTGR
jgi:hypothetical protein